MLDRTTISGEFEKVIGLLKGQCNPLVVGGFCMIFHGLKDTTKDIDLIFQQKEGLDRFQEALKKANYKLKSKNEVTVYQGPELRFDLFLNQIFNAKLNERILNRSEKRPIGNRIINFASREDLAVLKGLSSRERDLEDLVGILRSKGFEWEVFQGELLDQLNSMNKRERRFCAMNLGRVLEKLDKKKSKQLADRLWDML